MSARTQYQNAKQGSYKSIITFKGRFTAALQRYKENGNLKLPKACVAMDFIE
jgi:hypothetical protein